MTDEAKRLVAALRNSYGYSSQRDKEAADMIEKLTAEGKKLKTERNEYERRCKAAEHDIETLFVILNGADCATGIREDDYVNGRNRKEE